MFKKILMLAFVSVSLTLFLAADVNATTTNFRVVQRQRLIGRGPVARLVERVISRRQVIRQLASQQQQFRQAQKQQFVQVQRVQKQFVVQNSCNIVRQNVVAVQQFHHQPQQFVHVVEQPTFIVERVVAVQHPQFIVLQQQHVVQPVVVQQQKIVNQCVVTQRVCH